MKNVFFRTKSAFTGRPILVATVFHSSNEKTGPMAQVYILPDNGMSPHDAFQVGEYVHVCGTCPHQKGACYVNRSQGPRAVFSAIQRGIYQEITAAEMGTFLKGHRVRFGADGDPAAIPMADFSLMSKGVKEFTGYTHAWRLAVHLKGHCMASVDMTSEYQDAVSQGWRTFRVMLPGEQKTAKEVVCPADSETGKTCFNCLLCNGNQSPKHKGVVITVHGIAPKLVRFREYREMMGE